MANRFPLVLNKVLIKFKKLASGDTLDLTGSGLNLTGITTLSTSAELNLGGGTNINTGSRGDILVYNASGNITKLTLGVSGKVLKSNGSDLTFGDVGGTTNVYYVAKSGTDASGYGGSIDTPFLGLLNMLLQILAHQQQQHLQLFLLSQVYMKKDNYLLLFLHTQLSLVIV